MRLPSQLEPSSLSLHSHDQSLSLGDSELGSKRLDASRGPDCQEADVMSPSAREADSLSMSALSVILISPDDERRRTMVKALAGPQAVIASELTRYPQIDDLPKLISADHDVVIIDLDPDPERALDVIEAVCGVNTTLTVIAYSSQAGSDLLVRCMRAGAREFLTEPILPAMVAEALVRASVRRDEARRHKKVSGKLFVFLGAKGGSGVTTVASNFAVALAAQGAGKAALIDLDLQLGDAAMNLGITSKFTVLEALENSSRLDSHLLSVLMADHSSGLKVLAAPDTFGSLQPSKGSIERLLNVARDNFSHLVVDAGSHSTEMYETLFDLASTVYLISQVNVTELRNTNRFVARYFSGPESGKLQVVLNRFLTRNLEIDEEAITRALTRPIGWKIPNDYPAVRRAQNTGTPLALEKSSIGRVFSDMAKSALGQVAPTDKKKKFGLF